MALIKCPECGKEVSDTVKNCIHCGFDLSKYIKEQQEIKLKTEPMEWLVCPICGFVCCDNSEENNEFYAEKLCYGYGCGESKYKVATLINAKGLAKAEPVNGITEKQEELYRQLKEIFPDTLDRTKFEKQMLYENRRRIRVQASDEILRAKYAGLPNCPHCNNNYSVRKVSTFSRVMSTGFFGLGSSKIGKQWHCSQCGTYF